MSVDLSKMLPKPGFARTGGYGHRKGRRSDRVQVTHMRGGKLWSIHCPCCDEGVWTQDGRLNACLIAEAHAGSHA